MTAKTIGLIGGMSWESTALYYKLINQEVGRRLGCTEIGMLIDDDNSPLPTFDATAIHAAAAA